MAENPRALPRGLGPRQPGLQGSDPDRQEVALSLYFLLTFHLEGTQMSGRRLGDVRQSLRNSEAAQAPEATPVCVDCGLLADSTSACSPLPRESAGPAGRVCWRPILLLAFVPGLRRAMQQYQVLCQQGHGRVLAQPDRNVLSSTVGGAGGCEEPRLWSLAAWSLHSQ